MSERLGAGATRRDFLRLAGLTTAGMTTAGLSLGTAEALAEQATKTNAGQSSAARPRAVVRRPAEATGEEIREVRMQAGAHPAVQAAAKILAKRVGLTESAVTTYDGTPKAEHGVVVLALASAGKLPAAVQPKIDGYTVTYTGGVVIWGARPRSLLFAAGEPEIWHKARTAAMVRTPEFTIRNASLHGGTPLAEQIAALGANFIVTSLPCTPSLKSLPEVYAQLSDASKKQLDDAGERAKTANAARVKEFHDMDVEVYALLPYGNNFQNWSRVLYAAVLKAYPTAKGVPLANSHELAALCPSDPATWKVFDAFVGEWAEQVAGADGISATFWDAYGAYCQDARCKSNGLSRFPNELYEFISHYHAVLKPTGLKLHLRTWSSGCPHWLGTNYVHAPGYGQFGLSHPELWARVIKETPADVLMQTKVYHSDCEPDPRFSTLLGKCAPHTEIVEYQITGQTIGRHYFASSTAEYMAWTMKQSHALIGAKGGVQVDPNAGSGSYDPFADIMNSSDLYVWRQLSWDLKEPVEDMLERWARVTFGDTAAPAMARFIRASEEAVYKCWSPLGHGSATNSDFAGTIARREVLLRYTNRYYLPQYAAYLEPTKENVERCAKEKAECIRKIDEMDAALNEAKPHLKPEQAAELTTRQDWFRQFAICNTTLDESLWRYRYLRGLAAKLTTDPAEMKELAAAYDRIEATAPKLFQFEPGQKFSCYNVTMGELRGKPNLGNPRILMGKMYSESLAFVMESVGPDYLDPSVLRGSLPKMSVLG